MNDCMSSSTNMCATSSVQEIVNGHMRELGGTALQERLDEALIVAMDFRSVLNMMMSSRRTCWKW